MSDSLVNFKVGDAVKIKVGTEYYGEDRHYNPADVVGIVVQVKTPDDEGYMYGVRWETDCSNVYRPEDLELAVSTSIPTEDLQSELTEAYAKIDTLESALEDAIRELISLRERNNTAAIDVEESEFKPISEMTLEDWEMALQQDWLFEMNKYEIPVQVTQVDYRDTVYPVEFNYYMWRTLDGYEWADDKLDVAKNIIKRIQ